MKILILVILATLCFGEVSKEPMKIYSESRFCEPCHKIQVEDWKTTWHSRSHINNNILYKKVVDYVSKTRRVSREIILMKCSSCHNPRITKTDVKSYRDYQIAKGYGLDTRETIAVDKALKQNHIKEGINCIVCHNIDKINNHKRLYDGGHNRIIWTKKNSTMTGPFDSDSKAFHTNQKRDFFRKDANKLCFVCHYGSKNKRGLALNETGIEYEESNSTIGCVECHMSLHKDDYIAKHLKYTRDEIKLRKTRSHKFAGVRNSDIVKKAIELSISKNQNNRLKVTMQNRTPHKFPTGFGGREVILEVKFKTKRGIVTKESRINIIYVDNMRKETISYLAYFVKKDTRLKPLESRDFLFDIPKQSSGVTVRVWYKLVSDKIKKMIKINDPVFNKKYKVIEYSIDL